MNSEHTPFAVSLALSLALNSVIFLKADQSLSTKAVWHTPQPMRAAFARAKSKKIELEFVEAPPQKLLRKPERSKKIAARDSLAQDLSKLKTQASLVPSVAKLGPSDQLAQRRMEDRPFTPLIEPKPAQPQMTVPKDPAPEPQKQGSPMEPGDAQSWLPIRSASVEKKIEANPNAVEEQAQEKALDQTALQLSSRDKITTMEMAVKRSSGAPFQGVTSFEATGSGMGAYMKNLKEKIWLEWFPYIAFRYPADFQTADAVVRFTVGQYGEIKSAEVLDYRGSPMFATFCLKAIRSSKGFGPLPKDLLALTGRDDLEIKFAFHYR